QVLEIHRLENRWKVLVQNKDESDLEPVFDEIICTLPSHSLSNITWKNLKGSAKIDEVSDTQEYPLNLV